MVDTFFWLPFYNANIFFGVDGISVVLILLTSFLTPICILLSWNTSIVSTAKDYNIAFLVLESILFGVFLSLDVLFFYVLFEAVLIPMYIIVGCFGSRERRIRASYLLFLYTLVSSLLMFLAILFLFFRYGTTNYLLLKTISFDPVSERFCWFAFFFSFAVKMPLIPFHIWLPEAHCEADFILNILKISRKNYKKRGKRVSVNSVVLFYFLGNKKYNFLKFWVVCVLIMFYDFLNI